MKKFKEYTTTKKLSLDERYMKFALKAAEDAKSKGEKAIGAVLVWPNHVLSDCPSQYEEGDCTAHAVINVLRKATQMFTRHLSEAVLYTTIEPCLMCAMAAHYAGIQEMVYGCFDVARGFHSTNLLKEGVELAFVSRGGILAEECYDMADNAEYLRIEA